MILNILVLCFIEQYLCQCTGPGDCAQQFFCNTTSGACQRFSCSASVNCPDSIGGSYCEPNTGLCYSSLCYPFGVCSIPGFVCSNTGQCVPSVGICFQSSDCPTDFYCLCGTCISTACFSNGDCQQFYPTTICLNSLCTVSDCRNASCGTPCINASFQCNPLNGQCETGNLTTLAPTTVTTPTNSPSLSPTLQTNSPSFSPTATNSPSSPSGTPTIQTNRPTTTMPSLTPTTQNKEPPVSYYILYAYIFVLLIMILAYLLYTVTRPRKK